MKQRNIKDYMYGKENKMTSIYYYNLLKSIRKGEQPKRIWCEGKEYYWLESHKEYWNRETDSSLFTDLYPKSDTQLSMTRVIPIYNVTANLKEKNIINSFLKLDNIKSIVKLKQPVKHLRFYVDDESYHSYKIHGNDFEFMETGKQYKIEGKKEIL